jgi:hypothetical protein
MKTAAIAVETVYAGKDPSQAVKEAKEDGPGQMPRAMKYRHNYGSYAECS